MKFSRIILSLIVLSVVSCAREEDKLFNGTARINGVVLFDNITTSKSDTAKNAKVTLTNSKGVKIIRPLINGTFNIEELVEGTYTLDASYDFRTKDLKNAISYSAKQNITFTEGEYKADQSIIVTNSIPYSNTALKLLVRDDKGAILPNAQVCLYTSKEIMQKNANTCVGSMRSGATNQNGIVLFDELEKRVYYVSAYKGLGKDTLTNKDEEANYKLPELTANSFNAKDISLKLQVPKVKPDPTLLKVNITDSTGIAIPNATACLYSDPKILAQYKLCEGTTGVVVSDAAGVATFSNLNAGTYYVVAYATIKKKLLANTTTKLTDKKAVEANKTNTFNVYIKP